MLGGIDLARWEGDWVWCVSRIACLLRPWKSTVLLGSPDFLAAITMRLHHVTGVPIGTGSRTPSSTSLSKPALTFSCQWIATGIGEWCATGGMSSSTWIRIAGPDIIGSSWCSHVLNTLDL